MMTRERHQAYLNKVQATYKVLLLIDEKWPPSKFPVDNERWCHELHIINGDEMMSNEDKTTKLHGLIDRIKGA